ncbi:MAG: protein kinase [Kamptonema sp. SIO1D9]|nr:protein kinase [Kamptonema sp. SIO1D9]
MGYHWTPGHKIQNNRYTIEEILGGGGFGVTYRARDDEGNLVAIKTLNAMVQAKADFAKHQERFIQEAFRLAKCSHPHVIRVDDVCKEDNLWCMVMEYLDGENLEEYVEDKGILTEADALRYIKQVGEALDYVHQQGFLHRDVKPANIMLRGDRNSVVLIDFGLAREFVTGKIKTQTNSRTECFAPPEQYKVKAARGAYTDVYALAATLYYLLTEQLPFPANFRQQGVNLIPPQQHNPQISNKVNAAIIKGMELEAENRSQSVREWLNLLFPKGNDLSSQGGLLSPKGDDLSSEVGVDYTKLRNLLAAGEWKEADEETGRVMVKVANREEEGWLSVKDIDNFPCTDLRTIDQLWVKYSKGRFGFSVQKQIYQSLGGTRNYEVKIWEAFGSRVGWRKEDDWLYYKDLTFDLTAPLGHLPVGRNKRARVRWVVGGAGWGGLGFVWSLLSRRDL